MPLQLLIGSSGSGKSFKLYKDIISKSMENELENYLVIVPEQFTMQTQKDIVMLHPQKGTMNIDILSFMRLAHRIFTEISFSQKLILDDIGKTMMLRKVIEEKKDELTLFSSNVRKQGFISELKSLISEFYQYSITDEEIEKMINKTENKPLLNAKLKDIRVIFNGFKHMIEEKYITAEEILDILRGVIKYSDIIKNGSIYLDGFTGFTPSQYKLLEELMKYSKKIVITITIDVRVLTNTNDDFSIFHLSKKTINRLNNISQSAGIIREKDILINDKVPHRFKNCIPLAELEKNLFRYPYKEYLEEQDNISIHLCKNPISEVKYISHEILELIKQGFRYKDIAIVTGDINTYGNIIKRVFDDVRIPYFLDNKKSMLSNPLVELITSSLEVITRDFTYESMFRYLRCGLCDISNEDIDILENYVLALGIKGYKRWKMEWIRQFKSRDEIDLDKLNEIRTNVMKPIITLRKTLNGKKSVKEFTIELYNFILSLDIQRKLENYSIYFGNINEKMLEKEYKQIYKIAIDILEKIVDLLGDSYITANEYRQILISGFEEASIGVIPPGVDQVVAGDIERTRLKDIKALFFIGVNDTIVPKSGANTGILSDLDRELLISNDMELAPTNRLETLTTYFYLYLNLTKPQDRLYICYSKLDSNGKAMRPSNIITKINKIFPNLKITQEQETINIDEINTESSGIELIAEGLREYVNNNTNKKWMELFNWYYNNPLWKDKITELINASTYTNKENKISKAVSNAIYGKQLINSVTRLEKYASCAYSHFLKYGLQLMEREIYKLGALDLGLLFHSSLENFSNKLREENLDWADISEEKREELVAQSVAESTDEYGNYILKSSKRNEYAINRITRIINRTVWAISEHIKHGKFKPNNYEIKFSSYDNLDALNIPLSKDENIFLQGQIDRVDKYDNGENIYLKIVDYKSGNAKFELESVYYGLQFQLMIYLNAAVEIESKINPDKNIIPAGIFYYNIKDPLVDREGTKENIDLEILKKLKVDGLVNDDPNIIKLLDDAIGSSSNILPVGIKKDGSYTERSKIASTSQFSQLSNHVYKNIKEIGEAILSGVIEINPYAKDNKTSCEYCEFKEICSFDLKLPNNEYRKLPKIEEDKIWEILAQ